MGHAGVIEFLQRNKERINEYLFNNLPRGHELPEIRQLYDIMRSAPVQGGKGLRSTLCMLICEAFGGNPDDALNTAACLDLLENWLIIHDDIEDGSDLRRGEPCLYRQYGIPIAINVGDALHCQMWKLLQQNAITLSPELTLTILSEFSRAGDETVAGQHIEQSWMENKQWILNETDYYTMCEKKTSWYTCITPCRLGALIARAEEELIDAFIPIGANLGVAFQIQDDVLNLIGDEGIYGKEIAGDINEGKRTLVLIHLLNSCTEAEIQEVLSIMNKERQEKSESEIKRVLELMIKYESIRYAQEQAKLLSNKAKQLFIQNLGLLPNQSRCAEFLELIDFVIEREY